MLLLLLLLFFTLFFKHRNCTRTSHQQSSSLSDFLRNYNVLSAKIDWNVVVVVVVSSAKREYLRDSFNDYVITKVVLMTMKTLATHSLMLLWMEGMVKIDSF